MLELIALAAWIASGVAAFGFDYARLNDRHDTKSGKFYVCLFLIDVALGWVALATAYIDGFGRHGWRYPWTATRWKL